MTKLQKTLVATALTAAIGTGVYEGVQNSKLRGDIQTLQQEQAPLIEQVEQLQRERDEAVTALQAGSGANHTTGELLKLRGEVARLRGEASRALRAEAELAQFKSARQGSTATAAADATSSTLAAYLGEPVPPPANLDPAYTKEGLLNAIQQAAQLANIPLQKVEIETSEFPYLVGVIYDTGADSQQSTSTREKTKVEFETLAAQIKNIPGYKYSSSVGGAGKYAYDITPIESFVPSETRGRIERRTLLRLKKFSEQLGAR